MVMVHGLLVTMQKAIGNFYFVNRLVSLVILWPTLCKVPKNHFVGTFTDSVIFLLHQIGRKKSHYCKMELRKCKQMSSIKD